MDNLPNSILHQFFKDSGLTQREAAAMMGYHEAHLSRIVRGERAVSRGFLWRFKACFATRESEFFLPDADSTLRTIESTILGKEPAF
jgi:plasmid maintenance system antidote protein VapI